MLGAAPARAHRARRRAGATARSSSRPTEAARGLAFDVVFVPGLAERLFPRKIVEDPILLDASRARSRARRRRARHPGRSRRGRAARAPPRRRRRARARACSRTRASTSSRARPRVPSFYALEALRAAEGGCRASTRSRARAREQRRGAPRLAGARARRAGDRRRRVRPGAARRRCSTPIPKTTIGTARYLLGANVAPGARAPRPRASLVEALDAGRRPRRSRRARARGARRAPARARARTRRRRSSTSRRVRIASSCRPSIA